MINILRHFWSIPEKTKGYKYFIVYCEVYGVSHSVIKGYQFDQDYCREHAIASVKHAMKKYGNSYTPTISVVETNKLMTGNKCLTGRPRRSGSIDDPHESLDHGIKYFDGALKEFNAKPESVGG